MDDNKLIFFAAVRSYNDCESYCNYVINDQEVLKQLLIDECENCFQTEPSWTMEQFESEYYCHFKDYIKLKEEGIIDTNRFSFYLSDMGCELDLYSSDVNEIDKYLREKGFEFDKLTVDNAYQVLKDKIL